MAENGITDIKLVIIGGSAGSLDVLIRMLAQLRLHHTVCIVIVIHRKSNYHTSLADLFQSKTALNVREVEDKEELKGGSLYVAPADYHLLFEDDGTVSLDYSEKVNYSRPSIDVSFESAAEIYKSQLYCILLSGANQDGVEGMRIARQLGATIIVQDPSTAEIPFMPQQAIDKVEVDSVLGVEGITEFLNQLSVISY